MRVVVVGATGNVGLALLRALAGATEVDSIVGVARRRPDEQDRHDLPHVEWREADVASDDLAPVLRGAGCVVHLAWEIQPSRDLDQLWRTNVHGSSRLFRAAVEAGASALVYASSVGAYAAGPKDRRVDERWPTDGVSSSHYGRHKAEVERRLDRFEREHPDVRVARLRPGLIFSRHAASEIRRLFAGPFFPSPLLRPSLIPVVPDLPGLAFQAVHSADAADAYRRAVVGDTQGAFNLAAEPVLDAAELARLLAARLLPMPKGVARTAVSVTWHLRLQPTPPGWVDLALAVPLMDTTRIREELGWRETRTAGEALLELLEGLRAGAGASTPPLEAGRGLDEVTSGVGSRNP